MWSVLRHPDEPEVIATFGRHPTLGFWCVISDADGVAAQYDRLFSADENSSAGIIIALVREMFFAAEDTWAGQAAIREGQERGKVKDTSVRRAMRVLLCVEGSIDGE